MSVLFLFFSVSISTARLLPLLLYPMWPGRRHSYLGSANAHCAQTSFDSLDTISVEHFAMGSTASKSNSAADCPVINQNNASSCPVPESQRNSAVYNVYNQRIDSGNAASTSSRQGDVDPRNNMPREPNQQPCAGQRQLISTSRLVSNIPKGGTQGTWVYPSPQMFYNGEQ